MRTTIQIPDPLLRSLMRATASKTKTRAVLRAIRDFVRREQGARMKGLSGRLRVDLDWRSAEALELRRGTRSH